jgi:tetratricopeptide (TPR) repeat protein
LREENVDLIVKAAKGYKDTESLEELLKIIKGYSKLGFYGEVKEYTEKFLEKGGSLGNLISISKDFPAEIKKIVCPVEIEIDGEFDADSFLEMGELLWEIGSPDEAKDNYIKAFEYYSYLGNEESAQQVLKTLKERYPKDKKVKSLMFKDTKDEIIPKLKAFIPKPPKDEIDLRYALGKSFHGENMLSEAEINYRRVLELDNSHNSKRLLVALLRERGSFGDSLNLARELEEEEKLEELYSIYESLRDSGKAKIGEDVLKEIYGINPDFKNVKNLLGVVSEEEKLEEAPVDVPLEEEKKAKVGNLNPKDKGFEEKKIVFL